MNVTIYTVYDNFIEIGGAEKVALNVHNGLKKKGYKCKLMARNNVNTNNSAYKIDRNEYIKLSFGAILKMKGSVVISHHRKITTLLEIINRLLKLKIRVVHVAHNEFFNLKRLTIFPKEIIAVSERVKQNLINFFNIPSHRITVVYNGLPDVFNKAHVKKSDNGEIKILYPARITKVKRQIDLVKKLKGKLKTNITISFAGQGELSEQLEATIGKDENFKYLGFVNLCEAFHDFDYVLLFSEKEGLPLSLVEAAMFCKPIVCNDVGGNTEIVINDYNGYVVNEYSVLVKVLNELVPSNNDAYKEMSQNSRHYFENHFNEETMLLRYLQLIEQ